VAADNESETDPHEPTGQDGESVSAEPSWQRARRPDQKQARRDAIIAAAVALLDERGLDATSLSAIARTSGVSKANIYRYFESREAILLALTLEESGAWIEDLVARLAPLAGSGDAAAVADALASSIVSRPLYCTLLSSLASVLEHNVGPDTIAEFKRGFITLRHAPAQAVLAALPTLTPERAGELMMYFYVSVAGLWPVSNPPPAVVEVLSRPEFSDMCVDFETMLRAHAHTVVRGLCADD